MEAQYASPVEPLCRDCLRFSPRGQGERNRRCFACGSPRLVDHPERDRLSIAHIDCDAFYAAIEKRDNPALVDKPVIIGGGKRGVVSTACYVARTFGVRSAMPMFKALRACPEAVVIKPNMEKYAVVGRQVRALMLELTPVVEPLSIDEAFLDLSGTEDLHRASPALSLARFALKVEREIGITVSIGLAPNKFLAKIASDLDKPRGFSVIGATEAVTFLATKPVTILPGIGKAAEERLARIGIRLVGDIARADVRTLASSLGSEASRFIRLAHGEDARKVTPVTETKTISAETTFDKDISRLADLEPILMRLSENVARRLKRSGFSSRSVTLKLKTSDFKLRTRACSGLPPTQLAGRLYQAAHSLLAIEAQGTRFRLIGIGASDLCDASLADQGDLADPDARREARRENAIDALRDKFGRSAIERGLVFAAKSRKPPRS